jgi:hypothetical protein
MHGHRARAFKWHLDARIGILLSREKLKVRQDQERTERIVSLGNSAAHYSFIFLSIQVEKTPSRAHSLRTLQDLGFLGGRVGWGCRILGR